MIGFDSRKQFLENNNKVAKFFYFSIFFFRVIAFKKKNSETGGEIQVRAVSFGNFRIVITIIGRYCVVRVNFIGGVL